MKIDGKKIANKITTNLKKDIRRLKAKGIFPKLAIILVGEDPASVAYVKRKEIKAKEIGIATIIKHFPPDISQNDLLTTIQQPARHPDSIGKASAGGFNNDSNIHGIIIQQPLPKHINTQKIINAVAAEKDVDGFLPNSKFEMPIANAVLEILKEVAHLRGGVAPAVHLGGEFKKWLRSKKIVVIGKGKTGGQLTINMLKKLGIQPQIIDSKTTNHELLTKKADIIISAVGKQNIITGNMIKKGVILISIGLSRGTDGKMHGDYEEQEIKDKASFYTPTPGGVGPINIAMLLKNLISAAHYSASH
ncbi:MAG: bifunctional 5,10-methylenetetrahydrofolate dehydrogenase/5,10-methenyltetrahydrofolate cyclohydrolase [Candidatus Levybacteria bacterium]|nr:bifunctional 5,10-methylenetetrahydrofolate dehydrogenase/5,10-methenyltetrahydrofolate cyclohydrolase [Candidatus Levybacteria bacterium]